MTDPDSTEAVKKEKATNRVLSIVAMVIMAAGIIWAASILFNLRGENFTDNAQVDGYISNVSARVQSYIKEIRFNANQPVKKGDTLVLLVDDEFRIKALQAEADLENATASLKVQEVAYQAALANSEAQHAGMGAAKANYEKAGKDYDRYSNMYKDSAVTRNTFDGITAAKESASANYEAVQKQQSAARLNAEQILKNMETIRANIKRKEADLAFARLQLSYCNVLAPYDGECGERAIQEGQLVNAGQSLVSLVRSHDVWVTANFKEIQMENLTVGKKSNHQSRRV
jgi:membrane fusion protein (multidrug efflux system)